MRPPEHRRWFWAMHLFGKPYADEWLGDVTCGSDNRAGSAAGATHASGNRIRLCLGRRFRASHTRSTDPHTQSRRCLPNTARNAPCGWKARRRQVQNSYHLCCGEGKTPRISSLIICESGAHLFVAWCSRIVGCACMRPEVLGTCHRPHSQTATGRQEPSWQQAGKGERCRRSGATSHFVEGARTATSRSVQGALRDRTSAIGE